NGKAAIYLSGIWEVPQLKTLQEQNKNFEWDIVQFPKKHGENWRTRAAGSGYSILKTSRHPKESWEVVKALAGPDGQRMLGLTGLAQPADRQIAEGDAW